MKNILFRMNLNFELFNQKSTFENKIFIYIIMKRNEQM
jgi:hypothetical protein